MKKHLAVLAATAVLGVTSAFAANPFSDVTPQDWAYQAVAQLASQGVVNGYPDGTFKGQNNITRYEMAQMVAKAMARQGQVDAEQNAIINRLANEFSAELNNLGVRVTTLENKVGNFKFTGDARLKYEGSSVDYNPYVNDYTSDEDEDDAVVEESPAAEGTTSSTSSTTTTTTTTTTTSSSNGETVTTSSTSTSTTGTPAAAPATADRAAVTDDANTAGADVAPAGDANDGEAVPALKRSKFTYRARVQFEATVNDNTKAVVRLSTGDKEFGSAGSVNASLDRVYVQHNFGKYATATAGRYDLKVGSGLTYDEAFEGAKLVVGKDALNASVSYGYMAGGAYEDIPREARYETTAYQVNAKLGKYVDTKAYYVQQHSDGENYFGGAVDTHFGPHSKVWVGGEYARFEANPAATEGWTAGVGYGAYDVTKAGTWDVKAQYFQLGLGAPVTEPTWNLPSANRHFFKGWLATVDYAVAKNLGLKANAQVRGKYLEGTHAPNYYRVELNYKF